MQSEIDGFSFYDGAVKGTGYKWLDFEALCRLFLPRDRIVKIRYFTARVSARPDDPQQANRQDTYLRALATLPLLEIHYGYFKTRSVRLPLAQPEPAGPRTVEVLRTEEKGSDVNLATYLLLDAFKNACDTAVVISNDSDLSQAIRVAQSELGVRVGIVNPHPRHQRSLELLGLNCLFYKQVPRQLLRQAQLPAVLHDSKGPIRKPQARNSGAQCSKARRSGPSPSHRKRLGGYGRSVHQPHDIRYISGSALIPIPARPSIQSRHYGVGARTRTCVQSET